MEKGYFTVREPETYGDTIIVSAVDDMYRADKDYKTSLTFPATMYRVLVDACSQTDIPFSDASIPHGSYQIASVPTGTYRDVIGYIAMAAGGNARIDTREYLRIIPYDFSGFERGEYETLEAWANPKIDTNDVIITGVKTVIPGSTKEEDEEILVGEDGYAIAVENPLMAGDEETLLTWIFEAVGGVSFRPFEGQLVANPLLEFMDLVEIVDRRGYVYRSFLTDIEFSVGGYTAVQNAVPGMARSDSVYWSEAGRVEVQARKLIDQERSDREIAVQQLARALENASGMYSTPDIQEDGSVIYYLHDKPTIEESLVVVKITAEAFAFSQDGGQTYPYGWNFVTGDAVTNVLSAVGVQAEWVKVGEHTLVETVDGLNQKDSSLEVSIDRLESEISDTNMKVDDATQTTMERVTAIMQANEAVIIEALSNYVSTDEYSSFRQDLAAQLAVMADQVSIDISRETEALRTVNNDLQAKYEAITKNYRFTDSGLLIGASDSDLVLRLDNGRLSFLDGGAEVAYISDRTMYITDAHFLNSLRLGNFAFVPRDNGNLSFVKVGD